MNLIFPIPLIDKEALSTQAVSEICFVETRERLDMRDSTLGATLSMHLLGKKANALARRRLGPIPSGLSLIYR